MRRALLIPILALALGLGSTSGVEAAQYVGGGQGIRVTFRVKGNKVVQADVVARLYCIGPKGRRHFNRVRDEYAFPDAPLRLDRRGVFRWDTRGLRQEEGFAEEDFLVGRVGRDSIAGRYEYSRRVNYGDRQEDCRTGSFPQKPGVTEVPFRAQRPAGRS
jgi:hypothetical protein